MSKVKLLPETSVIVLELVLDKCEELHKKNPEDISGNLDRAFKHLRTDLLPESGNVQPSDRDIFGYGAAVGMFFSECRHQAERGKHERKQKDD